MAEMQIKAYRFSISWPRVMPEGTGRINQKGLDYYDTFLHHDFHNDDQLPQRSFYRWHIMDPILFEKDIRVTIQQIGVYYGGLFEREDDVASVAYWYQEEPHQPYGKLMGRKDRWPR